MAGVRALDPRSLEERQKEDYDRWLSAGSHTLEPDELNCHHTWKDYGPHAIGESIQAGGLLYDRRRVAEQGEGKGVGTRPNETRRR